MVARESRTQEELHALKQLQKQGKKKWKMVLSENDVNQLYRKTFTIPFRPNFTDNLKFVEYDKQWLKILQEL